MPRFLIDTNILIMVLEGGARLRQDHRTLLLDPAVDFAVSAVSLWELAIKFRLGKLDATASPEQAVVVIAAMEIEVLPLSAQHAIADTDLKKSIKDPFDRMIIAVAEQEGLPLLTTDHALLDHPLAWRP